MSTSPSAGVHAADVLRSISVPGFDALLQRDKSGLVMAIVGLNLALTLFTALVTLRNFPNSGDEYAYLLSGQLFSEGRLWVPSPEPRQFFNFFHVVNDGHYYGKYPPGWPLLLSLGVLLSAPWLVNPVLATLTLILIHRLAREHFSGAVANAALCATIANPFLIFNSASYFSHPSCLLFATLFVYASLGCLRDPSHRLPYLLMGAALGAAFLIRPYTSLALAVPFGTFVLLNNLRKSEPGRLLANLAIAAGPVTIALMVFLVYNYLQTGHPLLMPFSAYNPSDVPFGHEWSWRGVLENKVYRPLKELTRWIPLSVFLVLVFFVPREARRHTSAVLLLAGLSSLFIAYWFYQASPVNRYGPRYLYEASSIIFILIGGVIVRWKRVGLAILLVILCLNVYGLVRSTTSHAAQVRERMEVYDLVKEHRLAHAIVFLRTGSGTMDRLDLTRNGLRFDGAVLYALDLGTRNSELLRALPGRSAYVYEYDALTGSGRLTPYSR